MMPQFGRITALTIFIALASACATPSPEGLSLPDSLPPELEGCPEGTVEVCPNKSGKLPSVTPADPCRCVSRHEVDSGKLGIYQY